MDREKLRRSRTWIREELDRCVRFWLENGMDPASITIREFGGEAMHVAPDGKEGHNYTAEQVYDMLKSSSAKGRPKQRSLLSELFGSE